MPRPRPLWLGWIAPLAVLGTPVVARAEGFADVLFAQSANLPRGPGLYYNLFKFVPVVLIYILWTGTTHWIEKDTEELNNTKHETWTSIAFFAGLLGFGLLFLIPIYYVGIAVLVLAWLGPVLSYVFTRNAMVTEIEMVLTPYHFGELSNVLLRKLGVRKKIFNRADASLNTGAPPVDFPVPIEPPEDAEPEEMALIVEDLNAAKELIFDAISRRATDIHMGTTAEGIGVRYRIDGLMHDAEPFDRESGDAAIAILKRQASLDPEERRKPQDGSFTAKVEGRSIDFRLATSGSKGVETLAIRVLDKSAAATKIDGLGMPPKVAERVKEALAQPQGLILCTGPAGAGKSTTAYAILREIDRFQRNIITAEDPIEYQIDNVHQVEVNTKAGASFPESLKGILRQDPDVLMIGEVRDQETGAVACHATNKGLLVVSTLPAVDSVTALMQLLDMGIDPEVLSNALAAVVNQRLVRVLCEDCKEPYKPKPEFLQKANIRADRVDVFYRPPEAPEEVCPTCDGVGYIGRTGIFELLIVSEPMRDLIRANPSAKAIRAEAIKNGMIPLQDAGLRHQVTNGVTSFEELRRVLK